jgi:glycyl-tRNA synthetase beta chain
MLEFFIELFSEEIPARMQAAAAAELARICGAALAELTPLDVRVFHGPRRIAYSAWILPEKPGGVMEARGPRDSAPEAALAGFLGKYQAALEELVAEGGYFWLRRNEQPEPAAAVIAAVLAPALAKFSWPKSMRWGQSGDFTWVRPLRRVVCLLDGAVAPMTLGPVRAGNETSGHRVHAPGPVAVSSAAVWEEKLREHYVIVDADERKARIAEGLAEKAAALGLTVVPDAGLLDEVTGLVEWPVALTGKIDAPFMELPPEVRELSMKVNQKYFALRDAKGQPAPYFAFVANLAAADGGAAIVAGNERVLRARLADARHFWELDLKTPLDALLPKLEKITFHAKIGTQRERAERIAQRAADVTRELGADAALCRQAHWAGLLCKADLVTGMVGEFPELQGVMGGYYAERHFMGWDGAVVGPAIKTHYQPKGPSDDVPAGTVAIAVALGDKLDTLIQFFEIGEKPTGSGDPYALRRAALGVIRIILENNLRLPLRALVGGNAELFDFVIERLRVKLRGEGERHDVLAAVLAVGADDDLVRLLRKTEAVANMLAEDYGASLLNAYRRAVNILKIEETKDNTRYRGEVDQALFLQDEETDLHRAIGSVQGQTEGGDGLLEEQKFAAILQGFSTLNGPVNAFFDKVTVNADEPKIRQNRLRLLARLRDTMHHIADFSKIEG